MVEWHQRLDGLELSKLQELVMDREAWHGTRDALQSMGS